MKMRLLGLELSDAGIMLAGSNPNQLLALDGPELESPGYAFPEKKQLLVGKAAQQIAHLKPRLVTSHFWDQLSTEPLDHPGPYTQQNNAEIASVHLAKIWHSVKGPEVEVVIAVPGFYHQDHLGLLLGIANELSLPVKGFIPMALAAADTKDLQQTILHLDIHLHRTEIVVLKRDEQLKFEKSITVAERGLVDLHRSWVEAIAAEFVRTTRFDPLHQASSEQELFDRLPMVMDQIDKFASIEFEMSAGSSNYRATLSRELFIQKSRPLFDDIERQLVNAKFSSQTQAEELVLQLSHRIACLPGLQDALGTDQYHGCIELAPGAAALAAARLWNQLAQLEPGQKVSFFTSRPWSSASESSAVSSLEAPESKQTPSHLLFNHIAYSLSETPLLIGTAIEPGQPGIQIKGQISGVSRRHCSVELTDAQVVLKDFSSYGTFVDDVRVDGSTTLRLGQVIRVGTPGEVLHVIACVELDQ
jgi:hypothetical protein